MYLTVCVLFACLAFCVAISWHQYAKPKPFRHVGSCPPGQDAPRCAIGTPDNRRLRPTDADGAADWLYLQKVVRETDAYAPLHDGEIHESWREYWHGLVHPK
jgi:hypothetical protein